ncbi:hypothetical protein [Okeania sp. KiyG1]|uniref:hypothetical protein n=1 Tax=Okeania sp. KiyG1 TaxID=2720165 RepID=UPI0019226AA4|nr:hypothetical protein [Okeania sp. KiyG1]GFZ94671.1 hypothetical protein CYANOKiyG1_05440 [Okeania sp. KiyG1]
MEPVNIGLIVINALASGATLVASSVAREEIVVKYRSLKEFIGEKFGLIKPVDQLERRPSEDRQKLLAEDLEDAIQDLSGTPQEIENVIHELLEKTKALTELLEKVPKAEFDAVGIDIKSLKAVNVKIQKVISEGEATGVRMKGEDWELKGDMTVEDITLKK